MYTMMIFLKNYRLLLTKWKDKIMRPRNFDINIEIRSVDIDGNKIDVKKVLQSIDRHLKNQWNVSSYGIKER